MGICEHLSWNKTVRFKKNVEFGGLSFNIAVVQRKGYFVMVLFGVTFIN